MYFKYLYLKYCPALVVVWSASSVHRLDQWPGASKPYKRWSKCTMEKV